MTQARQEPAPRAPGHGAPGGRDTLTPATSWGHEDLAGRAEPATGAEGAAGRDILAAYRPPFEFTSDMLFVPALCPTGPLRRAFPGVPFLSLLGRTPLLVWFSRVKEGCAYDAAGQWRCEGGTDTVLYHELTVVATMRRRALFVPAIYATSARSVRLARHYHHMSKYPVEMTLRLAGRRFEAQAREAGGGGRLGGLGAVRARLLGSGRLLARLAAFLWPMRVWPVRFPAQTEVRGSVLAVPALYPALVPAGRLTPGASWLPRGTRLLPLGLYAADLRLRLPPLRPSTS
jgi:hypothetical protein